MPRFFPAVPVHPIFRFFRVMLPALLPPAFTQAQSLAPGPPVRTPSQSYEWASVAMGGNGFVSGLAVHPKEKNLIYARTDVGGAYRLNPSDGTWMPLLDWLPPEMASSMGVESLALDPRDPAKLYLLTGTPYWRGGTRILRSADRGKTWRSTDVSNLIRAHGNKWGRHTGERLAVDPHNGDILFCGSRNNGLWKSADGGVTWNRAEGFLAGEDIRRKGAKLPEHPATTNNGNGICIVVFDPAAGKTGNASKRLYVGLSRPRSATYENAEGAITGLPTGNFFISNDGGKGWRPLPPLPDTGLPPDPNTTFLPSRALVAEGKLFATFQTETAWGGGVFRYDPETNQWTDISPRLPGPPKDGRPGPLQRLNERYGGIDIATTHPPRMLVSTFGSYQPQPDNSGKRRWGERLFLSPLGTKEDGSGWLDLFGSGKTVLENTIPFSRGQTIHWGAGIALDPFYPERAFVTSGNGIWGSRNLLDALAPAPGSRSTWRMAVQGLEESVPMDVASIPGGPLVSVIWDYAGFTNDDPAVYSPHGNFRSCGGLNVKLALAGSGQTAGVLRLNAEGAMCWSADSGLTWKALEKNNLPNAGADAALALSADGTTILYAPSNRKVYRNHDPRRQWPSAGWTEVPSLDGAPIPAADPVDPSRFYAYHPASGKLLESRDGGLTFAPVADIGKGANWRIQPVPGRSGEVWIARHGQGISRWSRGVVTTIRVYRCTTLGFGRGKTPESHPVVFLWGQILKDDPEGLYRSDDEGGSWVRINDDQHQYGNLANGGFVKGCMNVYGRVFRSSAGRGVVYGTPKP